jgi:hypothetical protein
MQELPTAYPSGAPEFIPGFQWGSCYSIFSFMCMFCRSLFVLLFIFFWSLCSLHCLDLRIRITPLVLSNSSISCHDHKRKMVHAIHFSSKVHTLHTEKTIQENAINCKRQEVNDKILLQMYIIYNFSGNFHKVIPEKDAIDS